MSDSKKDNLTCWFQDNEELLLALPISHAHWRINSSFLLLWASANLNSLVLEQNEVLAEKLTPKNIDQNQVQVMGIGAVE
jgi:hypothetical protein